MEACDGVTDRRRAVPGDGRGGVRHGPPRLGPMSGGEQAIGGHGRAGASEIGDGFPVELCVTLGFVLGDDADPAENADDPAGCTGQPHTSPTCRALPFLPVIVMPFYTHSQYARIGKHKVQGWELAFEHDYEYNGL